MKKIIAVILIISLCILPLSAIAQETLSKDKDTYTYEEMLKIYLDNSNEQQKIEVNNELNRQQYEDYLDKYGDQLEDRIKSLENQMKMLEIKKNQTLQRSEEAGKNDKVKINVPAYPIPIEMNKKDYELNVILPNIVNAESQIEYGYKNLIEAQLSQFVNMEVLKVQLDNIDKQKEQSKIISKNGFQEKCLDYYLSLKEKELFKQQRQVLSDKIDEEVKKLELGLTTQTAVHQLKNQYLNLNKKEVQLNNKIKQNYDTLKKLLNISDDQNPEFNVELTIPETVDIIDFNIFSKVAKNNSLSLKLLNKQVELYKQYEQKVKYVYKSNDYDYKVKMLEAQKNELQLQKNIRNMDVLVKQKYNNYNIALKTYKLAMKSKDLAEREYKINQQKYEYGQLSKIEYKEAQYKHNQALYNYEKAVSTYIKALNDYNESLKGC